MKEDDTDLFLVFGFLVLGIFFVWVLFWFLFLMSSHTLDQDSGQNDIHTYGERFLKECFLKYNGHICCDFHVLYMFYYGLVCLRKACNIAVLQ